MEKKNFDELMQSMAEAAKIIAGEEEPSREFEFTDKDFYDIPDEYFYNEENEDIINEEKLERRKNYERRKKNKKKNNRRKRNQQKRRINFYEEGVEDDF